MGGQADFPVDRVFELSLVTGGRINTKISVFCKTRKEPQGEPLAPVNRFSLSLHSLKTPLNLLDLFQVTHQNLYPVLSEVFHTFSINFWKDLEIKYNMGIIKILEYAKRSRGM
jgi:hypothetical protein